MRILTWNINGIGTLRKYHPWNACKTCESVLDQLAADIVCFQEMKTSRRGLDVQTAIPGKYDGYFSFPVSKSGYSGVAVYSNSDNLTALRAEEGLTGTIQPKLPLSMDERISKSYPSVENIDLMADEDGNLPHSLADLDKEGRSLVVDFGLFVLINVYCVADSADVRYHYKMNFYYLLQERVRILIAEGREVIVIGDLNSCPAPIDHCEAKLPRIRDGFYDAPHRSWLRDWVGHEGPLVDIVRERWPTREGMYTCWNTKISARDGNYGTRIDLILITPGLCQWIKDADIQPLVKGSDHCPVYIDLHDSIVDETGRERRLRDMLHTPNKSDSREVPRICARVWDDFYSKQTLLSSFFSKGSSSVSTSTDRVVSPTNSSTLYHCTKELASPSPPLEVLTTVRQSGEVSKATRKRKGVLDDSGQIKRAKFDRSVQPKLSSFLQKSGSTGATVYPLKGSEANSDKVVEEPTDDADEIADAQLQRDIELATILSQKEASSVSAPKPSRVESKQAWSSLLTPPIAPNCIVHGEPCKLLTVTKSGQNKGKQFYVCSRPVGPGYDMGKSRRLRSEVDPAYRCDFFKWVSDVKRESMQQRGLGSQ